MNPSSDTVTIPTTLTAGLEGALITSVDLLDCSHGLQAEQSCFGGERSIKSDQEEPFTMVERLECCDMPAAEWKGTPLSSAKARQQHASSSLIQRNLHHQLKRVEVPVGQEESDSEQISSDTNSTLSFGLQQFGTEPSTELLAKLAACCDEKPVITRLHSDRRRFLSGIEECAAAPHGLVEVSSIATALRDYNIVSAIWDDLFANGQATEHDDVQSVGSWIKAGEPLVRSYGS